MSAAFVLFRKRGYDQTTMDDIARSAGVAKSSIYLAFTGKEDILVAGVEPPLAALDRVMGEPGASSGTYAERVGYVLRRGIEIELTHLAAVSVLLRLRANTPVQQSLLERRRAFERQMTALVADAIERGEFRAEADPALTTRLLLSLANWMTAWYRPNGELTPDELGRAVVTFAFEGLTIVDEPRRGK